MNYYLRPNSHSIPHVMSIISLLSSPERIIFDPIISDHHHVFSRSRSHHSRILLVQCLYFSLFFGYAYSVRFLFIIHNFVYILQSNFIRRRWKIQINGKKTWINISKTSYNLYKKMQLGEKVVLENNSHTEQKGKRQKYYTHFNITTTSSTSHIIEYNAFAANKYCKLYYLFT